ncbi:MAG: hypothetical protein ACI31M_03345 [Bacilli bacterium]
MEKIDIRNYLYHGIQGINSDNGSIYLFESILKTGYIVNAEESINYNVIPKCNVYAEMGYSSRISLGFYPLDQKIYELSKKLHPHFYGEKIVDKIVGDHNISYEDVDEFVINCYNLNSGLYSEDYAWKGYYHGITLLLNKKILDDLRISNYGILADEICIDEPINVRQYLEFVSIEDIELLDVITDLLEKYNYDCPIVEFSTGQIIQPKMNIKKKVI